MAGPYRATEPLGALVSEYRWVGGGGSIVIAVAMFGLSAVLFRLVQTGGSQLVEGSGAVLTALLGLVALGNFWASRGTRIRLHERGFVFHDRRGARSIEWPQVESIRSSLVRKQGVLYESHTIRLRSGDRVALFPGIEGIAELADRIRAAVQPALLNEALESIRAGRDVSFGPLRATPTGLVLRDWTVRWPEVKLRVDRGEVWADGFGETVRAADVDNLFVLLALAGALVAAPP